jgi:hypothetical protein
MSNEKELGTGSAEATRPMNLGPDLLVTQKEFAAHGPAELAKTRAMYIERGEANARALTDFPSWKETPIEGWGGPEIPDAGEIAKSKLE